MHAYELNGSCLLTSIAASVLLWFMQHWLYSSRKPFVAILSIPESDYLVQCCTVLWILFLLVLVQILLQAKFYCKYDYQHGMMS